MELNALQGQVSMQKAQQGPIGSPGRGDKLWGQALWIHA